MAVNKSREAFVEDHTVGDRRKGRGDEPRWEDDLEWLHSPLGAQDGPAAIDAVSTEFPGVWCREAHDIVRIGANCGPALPAAPILPASIVSPCQADRLTPCSRYESGVFCASCPSSCLRVMCVRVEPRGDPTCLAHQSTLLIFLPL